MLVLFWRKQKLSLFIIICVDAKFPKDIFLKFQYQWLSLISTQHYTRFAWNRFPELKMLRNDRMETASIEDSTSKWRRKIHVESSSIFYRFWKSNPRRKFHVESMSFSTWICLVKSMKYRQTFHGEFLPRIDGELTKMCPVGCCTQRVLRTLRNFKYKKWNNF